MDSELLGERVRLEPLAHRHHDGLCGAVRDGSLWELPVTIVPDPDGIRDFIEERWRRVGPARRSRTRRWSSRPARSWAPRG
ncbi:hypothetical protein V6P99_06160 [Streptomyces virginiae]|uniref:hypothetical protein n=1 Tax=Streptomyces virginiae TaxID=1961 RepID=UPI0030D5E168